MTERRVRRLVVITAGLGRPSTTRLLADRLADATRRRLGAEGDGEGPGGDRHGIGVAVIELRELANEIAQNMVTGFPGPRLREAVEAATAADGLIAVTPVFTGSYSGLFKSFFDIVDKEALAGTPVLIAATGGTARHSLALEHAVRPLFAYLRSVVVPTAVYAAPEDWGTGGDDPLAVRIDRAAAELAALVGARPPGRRSARAGGTKGDAADGGAVDEGAVDDVVPFAQQLAALAVEG
jgi:FMN reductase